MSKAPWILTLSLIVIVAIVLLKDFAEDESVHIDFPADGALVGRTNNFVKVVGGHRDLNHYVIVEVPPSGAWIQDVLYHPPESKLPVRIGNPDTPFGTLFRIYVLSTKETLSPGVILMVKPADAQESPSITDKLADIVSPPPQIGGRPGPRWRWTLIGVAGTGVVLLLWGILQMVGPKKPPLGRPN